MTESNQISEIKRDAQARPRYQKSDIIRIVLIVLVAVAVLAIGHYVFRAFRKPANAAAPGPIQFGRSAGHDAPDVPRPPRSEPAFAMPSPSGSGRNLAEYASQAAPEEVIRFYRAGMPRLGWTERKPQGGAYAQDGLTVLWYSNAAGDSCIIAVSTVPAAQTAVTIIRMTAGGQK
jgi:hypothetical protein